MNLQRDDILAVDTPERVELEFGVAGIGTRAMAQIADVGILFVSVFFVMYLVTFGLTLSPSLKATPKVVLVGFVLFFFLVQWGYFWILEAFWNGQTLGKRICGIRVMMADGVPITFFASTVRNLVRIVDFLPMGYGLGFLWMFFHPQSRRLGDLAAGTLVVREGAFTLSQVRGQISTVSNTETALSPLAARVSMSLKDYNLVSDFLSRRPALDEIQRELLATELAEAFLKRGGLSAGDLVEVCAGGDRHERFLKELVKVYLGKAAFSKSSRI